MAKKIALKKIRGSYYKLKNKGVVFYGAYEENVKLKKRTFTLTSSVDAKTTLNFTSPVAAVKAKWVRV